MTQSSQIEADAIGPVELYQPTDRSVTEILADWPPRRPLTANEAASLVAHPSAVREIIARVQVTLALWKQEIELTEEANEGVKS